jgi:hypothetical protein
MATWQNRRWILRVNCRATSLAMFGDTVVRERIEISGRAHWGGDGSGIVPSLSRAEFKSHFLFDSHCCLISRGLRAGRWTKISRAWIIPMERQFGGSRKKRSFSFSLSACGHEGVWLFSCSLFWQIRRMDISRFQCSLALFVHKMGPYEDSKPRQQHF